MNVLIDTPLWSLAFRRSRDALAITERQLVDELADLVRRDEALMLGVIRQEILSGIREPATFRALQARLAAFEDVLISTADQESAAECFNQCRRNGVTGALADMLICAVSMRLKVAILTTDKDFISYSRYIPIKLRGIRRVG